MKVEAITLCMHYTMVMWFISIQLSGHIGRGGIWWPLKFLDVPPRTNLVELKHFLLKQSATEERRVGKKIWM